MKFLWFGKKKVSSQPAIATEIVAEPQEIYSVIGYVCDTNPLDGVKNTQLSADSIHSMALSVLSQASSPSDIAAQEFFQQHGANALPISDFAFNTDRGFSARVSEMGVQRTILIGNPEIIARVSAPFSSKIAAAALDNANGFVVAIDGIAYASFAITKEII